MQNTKNIENVAYFFVVLAAAATQLTVVPSQGATTALSVSPDVFECNHAATILRDCYTYLRGIDTKPLLSCCEGAKTVLEMASKPEEQPFGCKCYKEVTSYFNNLKKNAMLELSKECYLHLSPSYGDNCGRS